MMGIKKKSTITAAAIYTFGTFLVQGINYLTLPVFARLMNTNDYGIYSSYENWVAIITVFIGIQTAASITNAYNDYPEEMIQDYVASISVVGWISFGIITAFTLVFQSILIGIFELSIYDLLLGLVQCLFAYFLTLILNEYRVVNKPIQYLLFSTINTVLTLIGGISLVVCFPQLGYIGRVIGTALAAGVVGLIAIYIIYRRKALSIKTNHIKYAVVLCFPLIFHALAGIIMGRMDQMMLLKLTTASEMGIYSYGNKLGHIVYVLYTAVNQAFIPWYYRRKKEMADSSVVKIVKAYIKYFLIIVAGVLCVLPEVIKLISPVAYYSSMFTAPMIIIGFYFNFLYVFPVNYEFYHKKTKYIAIGTIGSACINAVLNALLIPIFGGLGAASATCLAYVALLFLHLLVVKRVIKKYEMRLKDFIIPSFFAVAILLAYYLLIDFVIVRWIVAGTLGICICVQAFRVAKRRRGHELFDKN